MTVSHQPKFSVIFDSFLFLTTHISLDSEPYQFSHQNFLHPFHLLSTHSACSSSVSRHRLPGYPTTFLLGLLLSDFSLPNLLLHDQQSVFHQPSVFRITFTLIQIPMVSLRFMCLSQSGFNSPVSFLTRKSFVFFQRAMPFQALTFFNIYSSFFNALHFLLYMINTSTFKTTLKAHILCEAFSGSLRKFFNLSHIFPRNHPKIRLTTPNEKYWFNLS